MVALRRASENKRSREARCAKTSRIEGAGCRNSVNSSGDSVADGRADIPPSSPAADYAIWPGPVSNKV